MTKKRKIIYITIAAAIVIIAALAIIFMPKAAPQTVTEMLSTAQKYLVEMDYERAIAEFNKVIELDPMNADAYLGLAEAYEKSGDIDKAVETLEKGFELTGDERLQARIALLKGENTDNAEVSETETSITETTAETEVKYVNVQGFEIPTNITELTLIGPDTDNHSSSIETNEQIYVYRLTEPLTDISFLADFKNFKELDLEWNYISDIRVLSELAYLEYLNLNDNQVVDISALSNLYNLRFLNIDSNQITDISALKNLNLQELYIWLNSVTDIDALKTHTNMRQLDLQGNKIDNISSLSELTNLNYLNLGGNKVSDVNVLSKLTNLTHLYLGGNPISDSDIESLKSALPNCEINY